MNRLSGWHIEHILVLNVYNSLAPQVEQVKLKVQEQTLVFKTLQPVPVDDSSPFVGVLFSLLFMALN